MAVTIAISGKGGNGKTSMICLILRQLINNNLRPVLAVDADPNSTLSENLKVEAPRTIGDIREQAMETKGQGPAGISKDRNIEYEIEDCLVEKKGFDLLAMGRQEGPGCYCYINNVLRQYMDRLSSSYKYILVDNEAGMEHLSRRTTNNVDFLLIISEPTPISLNSAVRISQLADKLKLKVSKKYLVLNKVSDELKPQIEQQASESAIPLLGTVPLDDMITEYVLDGKSLLDLPDDSAAVTAINAMLDKLDIKPAHVG